MLQGQSAPVRLRPGRVVAVGLLCSVAATVAVWSGPLASASGALHSSAPTPAQVIPSSHTAK
jgi:hypothetical protein